MFVDDGYSVLTGAVKESPLIVLMLILLLHVSFLNLQSLPQKRVLDALNLKDRNIIELHLSHRKTLDLSIILAGLVVYRNNGPGTCGLELFLDLFVLFSPCCKGDSVARCVGRHDVPVIGHAFIC